MSDEESFVILERSSPSTSMDIYADVKKPSQPATASSSSTYEQKNSNSIPSKTESEIRPNTTVDVLISTEMVNSTKTEDNYSLLQQAVNDLDVKEICPNAENKDLTLTKNVAHKNANDNNSTNAVKELKNVEDIAEKKYSKDEMLMQSKQKQTNTYCSLSKQNDISGPRSNISIPVDGRVSGQNSLASSFLMGEIELDVLRANVFNQFPSLCGSQAKPNEILKLQTLMTQYMDLKETLQENNETMKQYFTMIQKWQNEMKSYKDDQSKQIRENIELIARLRNENLRLQHELDLKAEQIQINSSVMEKENDTLVKGISEKESIIRNLSEHINKLEQVQNHSFEFLKSSENDDENKYITVAKHKEEMRNIEKLLYELRAENTHLKQKNEEYIRELDNLKVLEVSAKELLRKAKAEIGILKSKDIEKYELQKCKTENYNLQIEMTALREQLDIYAKDFDLEHAGRQNLAREKDLLIRDLQMLQKRNQELMEAQEKLKKNGSNRDSSTLGSNSTSHSFMKGHDNIASTSYQSHKEEINEIFRKDEQIYERSNFVCPICNESFKTAGAVQHHVNDCIEKV